MISKAADIERMTFDLEDLENLFETILEVIDKDMNRGESNRIAQTCLFNRMPRHYSSLSIVHRELQRLNAELKEINKGMYEVLEEQKANLSTEGSTIE